MDYPLKICGDLILSKHADGTISGYEMHLNDLSTILNLTGTAAIDTIMATDFECWNLDGIDTVLAYDKNTGFVYAFTYNDYGVWD